MTGGGGLDGGGEYDPSKDPKGRGVAITACVLGVLLVIVLCFAYQLHAFWWQS